MSLNDGAAGHERRQLIAARRKARHYAVQALYQWALSGNAVGDIERQFHEDFDFQGADREYFHDALQGVTARLAELEASFEPCLDIALDKLDPVERAVLRLAAWELAARPDVPYRTVLDEAVVLTRRFGATDSHRFVNAVLDRLARKLRAMEASRMSCESP